MRKERRLLKVGVLGCNLTCDLAKDPHERMAAVHHPRFMYSRLELSKRY